MTEQPWPDDMGDCKKCHNYHAEGDCPKPDAFGLISYQGETPKPTRPSKGRVAVGANRHSVLMDIDLPDDLKECAADSWDGDVPQDIKAGLYDVEILWLWDAEWSDWHGKTFESFYIQAVRWPDGTIVGTDIEAWTRASATEAEGKS